MKSKYRNKNNRNRSGNEWYKKYKNNKQKSMKQIDFLRTSIKL